MSSFSHHHSCSLGFGCSKAELSLGDLSFVLIIELKFPADVEGAFRMPCRLSRPVSSDLNCQSVLWLLLSALRSKQLAPQSAKRDRSQLRALEDLFPSLGNVYLSHPGNDPKGLPRLLKHPVNWAELAWRAGKPAVVWGRGQSQHEGRMGLTWVVEKSKLHRAS